MKYWEIIAERLSKSGWNWGYVSIVKVREGRIFVIDAHREDGQRYIVHSDELLTGFLELQMQIEGPAYESTGPFFP
jgi:hypothetical protein